MPIRKGSIPHNKNHAIDERRLVAEYKKDRQAIKKLAVEWGVHITTLYLRLNYLGIKRRRGGDASKGTQTKENNPNWKGGEWIDSQGYVSTSRGRKHRLVAAKILGRPLLDREVVHHVNGDRTDNRPENIAVLMSQSEHMKIHAKERRAALEAITND